MRTAIPTKQYQGREVPCSARKRVCRQYRKGTQTKSPNTSINPKPSVIMSMVVRMASYGLIRNISKIKQNRNICPHFSSHHSCSREWTCGYIWHPPQTRGHRPRTGPGISPPWSVLGGRTHSWCRTRSGKPG